jgi:hypothetical protein
MPVVAGAGEVRHLAPIVGGRCREMAHRTPTTRASPRYGARTSLTAISTSGNASGDKVWPGAKVSFSCHSPWSELRKTREQLHALVAERAAPSEHGVVAPRERTNGPLDAFERRGGDGRVHAIILPV